MLRLRLLACTLGAAVFATACDVVVPGGETTVLGNRGTVLGVNAPNGVDVRRDGTLIVADADVSGRGAVVEQFDDLPDTLGAGIVSDGGFVHVLGGTVSGGNALVVMDDVNTPLPTGRGPIRRLPPALIAVRSVVDIMGGRLVSGGTFGLLSLQGLETAPGPALSALDSDVFISGGELRSGRSQELLVRAPNVVEARGSRVQINGGRFAGFVVLGASDTIITDGDLPLLAVGAVAGRFDPAPPRTEPGCTEIHGGSLSSLSILTPSETVFLFGTGFNLPLGPVPIAQVSTPGFIGSSPPTPSAVVTGTLASGTPLDLDVFAAVLSARVVLAAPGSPGCLLVGAR